MSGTGDAPNPDHGWLAKVLAGDPLMCRLLDLARTLPANEWAAFVRCGERMAAGRSYGAALYHVPPPSTPNSTWGQDGAKLVLCQPYDATYI